MPLEGKQFDHYRILQMVGSGGMGEVYVAEDIRIQRQVALKVIRLEEDRADDERTNQTLRLFLREATAIARLDHPHILPLYDHGEETLDGLRFAYLITPYCSEGSLINWLRGRSLHQGTRQVSLRQVTHIIHQAGKALHYAHERQVIHQDIKPANFLIRGNASSTDYPDLLLADFGIARLASATSNASQNVRGTPTYMAPEQWAGKPAFASDQYALAVMAYELLTGNPPFLGAPMHIMYAHLQNPPPPLWHSNPLLPPALDEVLLRALAKNPQERFPSVLAFVERFLQACTLEQAGTLSSPAGLTTAEATPVTLPPGQERMMQPIVPDQTLESPFTPPGQDASFTPENTLEDSYRTHALVEEREPLLTEPRTLSNESTWPISPVREQSLSRPALPTTITPGEISGGFARPLPARPRRSPALVAALIVLLALIIGGSGSYLYYARALRWPFNLATPGTTMQAPGTQLTATFGAQATANVHSFPLAPASQQVYRIGGVTSGIELDPAFASDISSAQIDTMLFTGLVHLNYRNQIVSQLAQSYSVSPDHLTYTFHLRPNLQFSDGTPLTAISVVYSLDRALSPDVAEAGQTAPTYLGLLKDADRRLNGQVNTLIGDSIITPDPGTVVLVISKPAPYFLDALAYPTSYVVEKSLIDQWGSSWTNHLTDNGGQGGAGPFKLASYTHLTGLELVPNTHYYGPPPLLQRVTYTLFSSFDKEYQAYMMHQLDLTFVPTVEDSIARQAGKEYHSFNDPTIFYVAMNYLYRPLNNIHIRQALALAIDKQALVEEVQNGVYLPTCHIVPKNTPAYNPHLHCPTGSSIQGDASKAILLFTQGLSEEGLTQATFPRLSIAYQQSSEGLINFLAQSWSQILGITINPQPLSYSAFFRAIGNTNCTQINPTRCANQGLAMWYSGWSEDYPDPQDWTTLQFDKNAPDNHVNYGQNFCLCAQEQQLVQQQLEHADGDNSPDRFSLYNQAEQQLVDDVAWLSLFQTTDNYLLSSTLIGLAPDQDASMISPNDWSHIYIARS